MNTPPAAPKTIYLIRHGIAKHNLPDPNTGDRPDIANDTTLTDPPLVRQGEIQSQILGQHLQRRGITDTVQLVICSPLTRCIQTAGWIFPHHFSSRVQDTDDVDGSLMDGPSLDGSIGTMGRQSQEDTSQVVLSSACKVFCHENVREAFGMHYPDKRSSLTHLKATFPTVQFHPSMTENDDAWSPTTRETYHDVRRRVHNFFMWLYLQPHQCIAVVSHGVWMECALMEYCPQVLKNGEKRVYNCDVYGGSLCKVDSGGVVLMDVKQVPMM